MNLIRLGAIAAICGGGLRVVDAFTAQVFRPDVLSVLYFATDVLLLAGVAALWGTRRGRLGIAGHAGLAVFVGGIVAIRVSAFGVGTYQAGAAVALMGLALYALETLVRRGPALAPLAWLVALAAGIAGAAGVLPVAMILAAGVAFGLGFVAAGAWMLTRPARTGA